ncbi:cellulose binding domain-containing protein, partial [Streptomyces sp. col6]|uniref:cellulose binding domain-containing protein n=1 Tax=Streptomyces sp. col6 TaxID=2478958 RepID=UPI001CD0B090
MGTRTHRRTMGTRTKVIGSVVAAAVIGGTVFALTGTAQASAVGAAYTRTSGWTGGYTGQYVVTNDTAAAKNDWTLEFDLPAGTKLSSLWNGEHTVSGSHVTVRPASWNKQLAAGQSVTVGFVAASRAPPRARAAFGSAIPPPASETSTMTASPLWCTSTAKAVPSGVCRK